MSLDGIYEAKLTQDYGSIQTCLNVFHYERSGLGVNAEAIARGLNAWVTGFLNPQQAVGVDNTQIEVVCLGDPLDYYTLAMTGGGSVSGDRYPTFVAFSVRFPRLRTDMRHGFKRFVGVPETGVNGEVIVSGYVATLQTMANQIVNGLRNHLAPAETIANFIIIKRVPYITSEGKSAYRLPETDEELIYYTPTSAIVSETVTSQVSRKRGT